MQYLTPVFTIVLAWLILSERISLLNTVGIIFVIAGVVLIGRKREASAKTEGGLLQH
jgi:drug/metabolite transporter (DMT)-like permease